MKLKSVYRGNGRWQAYPGVVAFLDGKNPHYGNFFIRDDAFDAVEFEELFCTGRVLYAGQALGMIVADTQAAAQRAASLVRVTYRDIVKPVLTIRDAMKDPDRVRIHSKYGPPNLFDGGDLEGQYPDLFFEATNGHSFSNGTEVRCTTRLVN